MGKAGVQQVAGAVAVDGGDSDGVPQPQVVKLIDIRVGHAHLVHFVHRQDHRLPGPEQQVGHVLVRGGQAGLHIAQENNHRGVGNGDLRLLPHKGQDLRGGARLNAAGVHNVKGPSPPFTFGVQTVPGDAGGVLHNGETSAHQFIKEHGLAHIGAAHNGDQRFCHRRFLLVINSVALVVAVGYR